MFKVKPIPAFEDNYIWALIDENSQQVALVDPGDLDAAQQFLAQNALTLTSILITHWHPDHTGGIEALCANGGVTVFGPDSPHIKGITQQVEAGSYRIFDTECQVIATPGHTLDHIVYYFAETQSLFCGDTLFAGGCGRMFEGTPEQMSASLMQLADLPHSTKVYAAHEYTLANRAFSLAVEPDNADLIARTQQDKDLRTKNQPTLPSTIGSELACNPFLRIDQAPVVKAIQTKENNTNLTAPADVFAALRSWKDHF